MPRRRREVQRSNAVSAVVGMMIILIGLSVFVPALMLNIQDDQSVSHDQEEGSRMVITGDLNSRLTAVNATQDEINVSLWDRRTGESAFTGALGVGNTSSLTISGETVNVTNQAVLDDTAALIEYDYPLYLGWPDQSQVIVENTPVMLLLGVVMLMTGILMTVVNRFF